jgi:dihydropteroate synthase
MPCFPDEIIAHEVRRSVIAQRLKACYPQSMPTLRTLIERRAGAVLMGILNRTPDSFSDGGRYLDDAAAMARIEAMIAEGAGLVDVGAESTRPGSSPVSAVEQLDRIGDVVRAASARGVCVSVDTTLPEVAERALRDGAQVVNSVSLAAARELGALCAAHGASLVLMHSRGAMGEMKGFSAYPEDGYRDVVADVAREWSAAAAEAMRAGLPREDLLLDPGLGFFKSQAHSLELLARLDELCRLGFSVLVGASRKSFLDRAAPPGERLGGSLSAALAAVERGAAVLRVHDVAATRQALALSAAVRAAARRPSTEVAARA